MAKGQVFWANGWKLNGMGQRRWGRGGDNRVAESGDGWGGQLFPGCLDLIGNAKKSEISKLELGLPGH